jgi:hypothetical protein
MTIARPAGPLSRLLVLDLTQFLAGPYAAQIFGDLGARVIKIEPPGGEMARAVAPHFVKGESAYYLAVNRNKESLAIDAQTSCSKTFAPASRLALASATRHSRRQIRKSSFAPSRASARPALIATGQPTTSSRRRCPAA